MLIAIDHGNHAIKTVHHSFVSGLARHSVRPSMADEVNCIQRRVLDAFRQMSTEM